MGERGPGNEREEREEERGDGEAGHFFVVVVFRCEGKKG